MTLVDYILPDGRVVKVDDTAAKGAEKIDFEIERAEDGTRRFVIAERWDDHGPDGDCDCHCHRCGQPREHYFGPHYYSCGDCYGGRD